MLAAGLKDAADSGHERGLQHGVVKAARGVCGTQASGCEVINGHGLHMISNVL